LDSFGLRLRLPLQRRRRVLIPLATSSSDSERVSFPGCEEFDVVERLVRVERLDRIEGGASLVPVRFCEERLADDREEAVRRASR